MVCKKANKKLQKAISLKMMENLPNESCSLEAHQNNIFDLIMRMLKKGKFKRKKKNKKKKHLTSLGKPGYGTTETISQTLFV